MPKNYIITLSVQYANDAEALAKTAAVAIHAGEIAYLKHGISELGFFTKDGDFGAPKRTPVDAKPAPPPVNKRRAEELARIDRFLGAYQSAVRSLDAAKDPKEKLEQAVDIALFQMLVENRNHLPPIDDHFFLKAFRTVGVTGSGCIDNAIWHLLAVARTFWVVLEKFQREEPVSTETEEQP